MRPISTRKPCTTPRRPRQAMTCMRSMTNGCRGGTTWASPNSKALPGPRSEEHTSELQSLMRISYAVFCLKKKKKITKHLTTDTDKYKQKKNYIVSIDYTQVVQLHLYRVQCNYDRDNKHS